jgi:hypothetical protein
MKHTTILCLIVLNLILSTTAAAKTSHTLRLGVFDNPQPDPSRNVSTEQFVDSYLEGINTGITVAASKGINIIEKNFFHANNLASIIEQAADIKAWKPDAIMGLSTSNDFLMSKAFFGDEIILSLSATDQALNQLPTNFYSLGIPDTQAVNAIINFIHQKYPHANLFITTAAESKESVDFADLLSKSYTSKFSDKSVIERKFLTDDMKTISFSKFMAGYKQGDVIVVMSIGYDSAIELMNKIGIYSAPSFR